MAVDLDRIVPEAVRREGGESLEEATLLAAEKAGWGEPLPQGRARGIAVHESFNSYVAQVAEIAVADDGQIKVEKVVCAVDCGLAVNPDVVKAQMEGGIGYGLGAITDYEKMVLAAAAQAAVATGAPITTHTDQGQLGDEQQRILTEAGVPAQTNACVEECLLHVAQWEEGFSDVMYGVGIEDIDCEPTPSAETLAACSNAVSAASCRMRSPSDRSAAWIVTCAP